MRIRRQDVQKANSKPPETSKTTLQLKMQVMSVFPTSLYGVLVVGCAPRLLLLRPSAASSPHTHTTYPDTTLSLTTLILGPNGNHINDPTRTESCKFLKQLGYQ